MLCHESPKEETIAEMLLLRIRELDEAIEEHIQSVIDEFEEVYHE